MHRSLVGVSLTALLLSGSVSAEGLSYVDAGYNFTRLTNGSDEFDVSSFGGQAELSFGRGFVGIGLLRSDFDNDFQITISSLEGGYEVVPRF